ncbi:hypothetical protein [Nocardioides sp. TF02-7]|uniref:hypothetical protein n=1 Tax=Nocardioides sp. TF02-7 TaxID=2917724 RepID=UPI001F06FA69|nr:hypothetical protein [Nocardioides sp. TF02-7]UMG93737.1 hypothetical protein MF408_06110 [Nocardioides sp. TF02-7]
MPPPTSTPSTLSVPRRFNGPPRSGNGGWTAGALAQTLPGAGLGGPVTVTLRQPPPLDVPMPLTETANGAVAHHDGRPVAEAALADLDPVPVPGVPMTEAAAAEERYAGHHRHPFPTCFACGPQRRPGDGLRIFPGRVMSADDSGGSRPAEEGDPLVAATWTPYEVGVPITWAALDCVGGWASDIDERPMVLGRMTARIHRLPTTAERYVVVGTVRGVEGRKTFTASTLYDPAGRVTAAAEHVWVAVDPKAFA